MIKCIKSLFDTNEYSSKLNKEHRKYILDLLKKLKSIDKNFEQLGSKKHKYNLNPVIPVDELLEVEIKYQFRLPEEYFWFITNVGNGGAGPYYGIKPFNLDNEEYLNLLGKEGILSVIESEKEYRKVAEELQEDSFLDWYEKWLIETIKGYNRKLDA